MTTSQISSIQGAVSTGVDFASTKAKEANGTIKSLQDTSVPSDLKPKTDPKSRPKRKYKHVEALHSKSQPSCLSHDSAVSPSFLGFRNLLVLVVIVMNLRLVIENFRKYGILITLQSQVRKSDIVAGLILFFLTPIPLGIAYIIELIAAQKARSALGRRKKSNAGIGGPETKQDQKDFYNTWVRVGLAHFTNATVTLVLSSLIVYFVIHNPGIGTICELHAVVVWLKICSYAFTNRDLRHAFLHPANRSSLPDFYERCPYPENINFRNLAYFWWAPTLVYQTAYPRTERIRWDFAAKRLLETVGLSVFIWLVSAQYAVPLLHNSLATMAELDAAGLAERVMKLSTISLITWLAGFFALFQSFLNFLAEIMTFGDRVFYDDWWNSTSLKQYWNSWNKPVYHFMRRHVYSPLVGRGWPPVAASAVVFIFSGFLHELVVGVPTHNVLGAAFFGMVAQLPLVVLTRRFERAHSMSAKVVGNCIFWVSFVIVGQPVAALLYFFAWHVKYGNIEGAGGVKR